MVGIMLQDLRVGAVGLGESSHRVIGSIHHRRYRHSIRGRVSGTRNPLWSNQIYGIMTRALHCVDLGMAQVRCMDRGVLTVGFVMDS